MQSENIEMKFAACTSFRKYFLLFGETVRKQRTIVHQQRKLIRKKRISNDEALLTR